LLRIRLRRNAPFGTLEQSIAFAAAFPNASRKQIFVPITQPFREYP
jgi:hypothetical protein